MALGGNNVKGGDLIVPMPDWKRKWTDNISKVSFLGGWFILGYLADCKKNWI